MRNTSLLFLYTIINLYKIFLKSFEIMNKYKCEWIYSFSSMTKKEVKKIVGKYKIHIECIDYELITRI